MKKHFSGMTVIPLETLGDSISSAVLVSWEKNDGDQVNEDDVIAVVETDKVTMDIRAKQSGVFSGGFCAEGDEVSAVGGELGVYKNVCKKAALHLPFAHFPLPL